MIPIFIIFALIPSLARSQESPKVQSLDEMRDYTLFDHEISIQTMRAGNNDPSGKNEYYFKVTIFGILNSLSEREKKLEERKKLQQEVGVFGSMQLDALSFWRPQKPDEAPSLPISGDLIRDITARMMTEHKVFEWDIAQQITIDLYEANKKFVFFGEDVLIGSAKYFPIPQTKFDTPQRTNLELEINDPQGAAIKIHVKYKDPILSSRK
jgi:hypothetical protein